MKLYFRIELYIFSEVLKSLNNHFQCTNSFTMHVCISIYKLRSKLASYYKSFLLASKPETLIGHSFFFYYRIRPNSGWLRHDSHNGRKFTDRASSRLKKKKKGANTFDIFFGFKTCLVFVRMQQSKQWKPYSTSCYNCIILLVNFIKYVSKQSSSNKRYVNTSSNYASICVSPRVQMIPGVNNILTFHSLCYNTINN